MSNIIDHYRVKAGDVAGDATLGSWSYKPGENCQIDEKLNHLNAEASGGYCYLRLMVMIPVFDRMTLDMFKRSVEFFKIETGQFPVAKDLIVRLAALNSMIESDQIGFDVQEGLMFDPEIFDRMMMNRHTFRYSVDDSVLHVSAMEYSRESFAIGEDPAIHDNLMFTSKFMIVFLGASNRLLGGTVVDLESLFGGDNGDNSTDVTQTPEELLEYRPTKSVINQIDEYMEEASQFEPVPDPVSDENTQFEPVPDLVSDGTTRSDADSEKTAKTIIDQHEMIFRLKQQLQMQDKSHRQAKAALNKFIHKNQSAAQSDMTARSSPGRTYQSSEQSSVTTRPPPSRPYPDSTFGSSISTRGENPLYRANTIITARPNDRHRVETIVEVNDLSLEKNVVIGYQRTPSMQKVERKMNSKVHAINGLANPFKSNRLNLLVHFHTAVETNLPIDDGNGYASSLKKIIRYKSKSPSEELAKQIVELTFDFDELRVVSNPYKLPFIEVGMIISDNCLISCFTLLKSEYESLWFQEMKSLYVPSFHKRFRSHSETISGRRMSIGSSSSSRSTFESTQQSSRKPGRSTSRSLFSLG